MTGHHISRGRPIAETAAQWAQGREAGLTDAQIAADLGIKPKSLERTLYRARRKGLVPSWAGRRA